jgi:LemA protein
LNNRIVGLEENVGNAWSDIDVQLRMRFDLVDNLVETVKGYAKHEKSTFKEIVDARNKFGSATDVKSKAEADNMLTASLKSLFALSEAYPELKSNENFLSLQSELSDIENKIASARRYFNAATREYNTLIKQFPANILFHKQPKDYFE